MENTGIELLDQLIKLDVDAARAYESAINALDTDPDAQRKLREFKGDHERHVRDLSDHIASLGGTPTSARPDLKGFFLQGFTAIRGALGPEQALKAMRMNEELTNRTYAAALGNPGLPAVSRDLVQRNFEDEKRHLQWINEWIMQRATVPA